MSQLGFDFDRPANEARLHQLLDTGEQPGVVERTEYQHAWTAVHGHFDSHRRILDDSPWLPWRLSFTVPGSLLDHTQLEALRHNGCSPTALTVDLRPDRYNPDQHPGIDPWTILWRGACLGCTWEGPHRSDENSAIEDAHDHTHPDWWRTLPTVTKPRTDNSRRLDTWRTKVIDTYETAVTGCTSHPAGCPVWTARHSTGTRHHHGGPLGGFDLGRPNTSQTRRTITTSGRTTP